MDNIVKRLFSYSFNEHNDQFEHLLKKNKNVNLNSPYDGQILIHLTVKENQIKILNLLIAYGADVNTQDDCINDGDTPLHLAVRENNFTIAEILLQNKAQANLQNINGDTPLHIALNENNSNIGALLLRRNLDGKFTWNINIKILI